eukprot:CAMPEP_0198222402 /NCGR_PEP_ID=MMETSP1445-20131203/87915_1 /TAXON_ID=36898 /ORGANISM="Pyramimonas sp., Strain CCMP2087" /LENGTH=301 /DNA_ID=CAMNT_0043900899 /DNA_START=129 /DNA_END=1034 /DNA_ORIENTATION=+
MASIACVGLQVASGQCLERCSTRAIFRPREARVGTGVFTTNAKRRARLVSRRTNVTVRASMGDPGSSSMMSAESAMKLLGVRENSSFDDIVRAKNRLSTSNTSDEEVKQIDLAYDTLLMQSFKKRQSGKVMDENVKYADVKKAIPLSTQIGNKLPAMPDWTMTAAKKLPAMPVIGGMPNVSVASFDSQKAKVQQGLFAAVLALSLIQGLSDPKVPGANIPATQLALAFGLSIYFLRDQKRLKLSRAALLTTGGLVGGAVLGGLLQSFLRVDVVPIGALDSPEVLVSEIAILALWATSVFLS